MKTNDRRAVQPLAVSIDDAAVMLGVGRTKVYSLASEGRLVCRKLGRRTVVTTASIRALLGESAPA